MRPETIGATRTLFGGSRYAWCLLLATMCARLLFGQESSMSPVQLQTLQLRAWSALISGSLPTSIVLNGTFTSIAGSATESGNAQLTVGADGSFAINTPRTHGSTSESRTVSDGTPACTWTDQNNAVHQSSFLNCLAPAWFFPGLALLSPANSATLPAWMPSSFSTDSLGDHLKFLFILSAADEGSESPQLLKPFDLVLAPATSLPQIALFTIHPDNPGVTADIPVKIAYSNYECVSGVMIPFKIQRYVNGSLVLDIAINSAVVQ